MAVSSGLVRNVVFASAEEKWPDGILAEPVAVAELEEADDDSIKVFGP